MLVSGLYDVDTQSQDLSVHNIWISLQDFGICADSPEAPEPSMLTYMNYRCRWRYRLNVRFLACWIHQYRHVCICKEYQISFTCHYVLHWIYYVICKNHMYLGDSLLFHFSIKRIKKSRSILQDHKFQKCFKKKGKAHHIYLLLSTFNNCEIGDFILKTERDWVTHIQCLPMLQPGNIVISTFEVFLIQVFWKHWRIMPQKILDNLQGR